MINQNSTIADKIDYAIEMQIKINEKQSAISNRLISIIPKPIQPAYGGVPITDIKSPENLSDNLDILIRMQEESLSNACSFVDHLEWVVKKSVEAKSDSDRVEGIKTGL